MASVTLITVSYNSSSVLPSLLGSIPSDVQTIIVDNGSSDTDETRAIAKKFDAKFVVSDTNVGFGCGCNLGANAAKSEFLFFVNPDAQLKSGAIKALIEAASKHPEASAFNPLIREANGKVAFKYRSKLLPKSAWLSRLSYQEDTQIPILSGAAIFVRRDAFEEIGGFDPNIFLFHEDDDLSIRLAKVCGPLRLVANAEVVHMFGHSTARTPRTAALKAWYMGQSRVYTSLKHGVPGGYRIALTEALLQLFSPITLLSSRKRAKHSSFLQGVLAARNQSHAKKPTPW